MIVWIYHLVRSISSVTLAALPNVLLVVSLSLICVF
jgi:hypothetical protein